MRRVWLAVMLTLGIVLATSTASWSAPTPTPTATGPALAIPVPPAVKPATVCTVSSNSHGAVDITGLVATKNGYVAVDGANTNWGGHTYIIYLNSSCVRTGSLKTYSGGGAHDPQDLSIDKNGTLWVADIGDADSSRPTIALWKVPTSGAMSLFRFKYPDSAHNASAMVLDGDGRPVFITRNPNGAASLYEPAKGTTLATGVTIPLTKIGTFTPEQTGTSSQFGILGQTWITGGAVSPDGTKVVLRTSSDAYEWSVKSGDVVGAITKTKPTITPMPQPYEVYGEAIAFTTDGTGFLSISHSADATPLLRYTPAKPVAAPGTKGGPKAIAKPGALRAWFNSLTLTDLKLILGGVAVFGLVLVLVGVFGIRRSRQKFRLAAAAEARNRPARPDLAAAGVGAAGVYGASAGQGGSGNPGAPAPGSGVYGAPAAAPGGGVYGAPAGGSPGVYGAPAGGGVYGAPGGGNPAGGAGAAPAVYGAPREPAYDPYGSGSGADYPAPDPYAAPAAPPGPPRSGGQYGGGQYGGGEYGGGQYGAGAYEGGGYQGGGGQYGAPNGGQYPGGQYGAPAQPPANQYPGAEGNPPPGTYGRPPADDRHNRPADPDEYDY